MNTTELSRQTQHVAEQVKLLLIDDEDRFRASLAQRLALRGYIVRDVGDPERAIGLARQIRPDVVVLDRKMPKLSGEEVLKQLKQIAPEVQVIILTGHGSIESAAEAGRLDAFAFLEKPCEIETLIATIEAAWREKRRAMARQEIPHVEGKPSIGRWLLGAHNHRPGVMLLGAAFVVAAAAMPLPGSLVELVTAPKAEAGGKDRIAGFPKYRELKPGERIADHYARAAKRKKEDRAGAIHGDGPRTARMALVSVGLLLVAALFWGTGALPIGVTALLVGMLMYFLGVFPPDVVAKSYAKDAVIFIFGVLALARGIGKTGLDRRIGMLLLGTSRSLGAYLLLFCPLLAVSAAFLSEHALVAFIAPVLMLVYTAAIREANVERDRNLAVMLMLAMGFAANLGGPGSPAAGGRNAIMVGILGDYGTAPTFAQWMKYGMPFVPVAAACLGAYFWLTVRRRVKVADLNVASLVRAEARRIGRMTAQEYIAAAILLLVIVLWITAGDEEGAGLGMGGPVLLGLVLMAVFKIITWRDINKIPWDVVALYGCASAIGAALATTGAALWIAGGFIALLPATFAQGEGLCVASSLLTGVLTQVMSDGATVSAVGPITVPMASLSGTNPWKVGFATAFSSSFANCFISGTPNNAMVFALSRDLATGEQLVTLGDFLKHGAVATLIGMAVLWGWLLFGYWRWIGF